MGPTGLHGPPPKKISGTHPGGAGKCRAGPPSPIPQTPQPTPMGDSSFANGGTCISHLTDRTVVAETSWAINLMKVWQVVTRKGALPPLTDLCTCKVFILKRRIQKCTRKPRKNGLEPRPLVGV